VVGGEVGRGVGREGEGQGGDGVTYAGRMVRSTAAAAGMAVAVAVVPGVIAAVRGIWVPTCDWGFGIEAYLAMPVVTAALAGAVGHALGGVSGPRRFVGAAGAQPPAPGGGGPAPWPGFSHAPPGSLHTPRRPPSPG